MPCPSIKLLLEDRNRISNEYMDSKSNRPATHYYNNNNKYVPTTGNEPAAAEKKVLRSGLCLRICATLATAFSIMSLGATVILVCFDCCRIVQRLVAAVRLS